MTIQHFFRKQSRLFILIFCVSSVFMGCQKDLEQNALQTTSADNTVSYTLEAPPKGVESGKFYKKDKNGTYQVIEPKSQSNLLVQENVPFPDPTICSGFVSCDALDVSARLRAARQLADSQCTSVVFYACCCLQEYEQSHIICRRYTVYPSRYCQPADVM